MKRTLLIAFCLFSFTAKAELYENLTTIESFETLSGEIISNLDLHESSKVLESLRTLTNFEIRERVFYPEEVSWIGSDNLTKESITAKRPHQGDYL